MPAVDGYAGWAEAGSMIIVHGTVSLQPAGPGGGATSGAVTTGAPALPYLSVSGTTTAAGELVAAQPVTVTFEGAIPSAPFACGVGFFPGFSTALAPLTLGELLIALPTLSTLEGTLNALGNFQLTLTPTVDLPALTNAPVFAQLAVFDATTGQVRLSNGQVRILQN